LQVSPVSLALQDRNPYVRRTAVLGVLKIYNLDAAAVRNAGEASALSYLRPYSRHKVQTNSIHQSCLLTAGMLEDLHDMLQKDPDAQVAANCMSVLLEVGIDAKLRQDSVRQLPWDACCCLYTTISCVLVQTGSGQSLVTRALVISLLNRIKVCLAPRLPLLHDTIASASLCSYVTLHV